ncbi:MAG: MBL fold metallo-hydrolase [Kiritimatiellae bacterium]|nr:MBL fold metallo-hydrolase [Kiritimatiellia bacterium]
MMKRRSFLIGAAATGAGLVAGGATFFRQAKFGSLPKGERLKRILASPNYRDGAFRNEASSVWLGAPGVDRGGFFKSLFRPASMNLVPRLGEIKVVKTDLHGLDRARNLLVWFGHSSCFLQLDGLRILVDPVFYTASPVSFLCGNPFPGTDVFTPEDIPDVDCLLITHDHWDHLDCRTVMELKSRIGQVVCPLGVGAHLECWGFESEQIVELDWHEDTTLRGASRTLELHCLPSHHFSGRGFERNQSLWASFLVEGTKRVYFAADGGYDGRFRRIHERFPSIDLALFENGQYNPRWAQNHTLPSQLAAEMCELAPKRAMTVHHGKFCISTHPWNEPYENERRAAAESGIPLVVPVAGEIVEV